MKTVLIFLLVLVSLLYLCASEQVEIRHSKPKCGPDDWRQYVGNTNPIKSRNNPSKRCYDPPNESSGNTIEKRVILEYALNTLVQRNYTGYAFISSPDTLLTVPQLGIAIHGQDAVIGYFVVADIDVTDIVGFFSVDITNYVQDGLKVAVEVEIYQYAPNFGANFTTLNAWFIEFNHNRTIRKIVNYVDTFSAVTKIGIAQYEPEIICPLVQERCTGSNQQYTDVNDCIDFLNTKPDGDFNQPGLFDTKYCRGFHLQLTINRPEIHCPHVGKNSVPCSGSPPS